MKTSSAKAKGRKLQQWVRDEILKRFPELHPDDVKSTSMGVNGEDVQLSPAAREKLPIQLEMKNNARHAVYRIYEQCQTHGNHEPVCIIKENRAKPLAVVDAEFLLDLLQIKAGNKSEYEDKPLTEIDVLRKLLRERQKQQNSEKN